MMQAKWLKAGILEPDGMVIHPDTGTPQGGIVSPILANVYLHYVLDTWFHQAVKPRLRGRAFIYRYADDWVCGFQYRDDAERFYRTMPKRLGKFNLEVEPSKTKILRFSRFHTSRKQEQIFAFLGFEFYWWHDQAGTARIKRHLPKHKFFGTLKRKLVGHYNYYYVVGNSRAVWSFYSQAIEQTFKWLNRRSQRKSYNWETIRNGLSFMNVPVPRVTEKKGLNNVKLH
jgi:RNA-directed DNA polymerase